jgi:hypothetical protein
LFAAYSKLRHFLLQALVRGEKAIAILLEDGLKERDVQERLDSSVGPCSRVYEPAPAASGSDCHEPHQ